MQVVINTKSRYRPYHMLLGIFIQNIPFADLFYLLRHLFIYIIYGVKWAWKEVGDGFNIVLYTFG